MMQSPCSEAPRRQHQQEQEQEQGQGQEQEQQIPEVSPDALRRSAKACNRCRKRRTKCAGNPPHPCVACRYARQNCVYSESEKRVTVSESHLAELQAQARRGRASSNRGRDARDSGGGGAAAGHGSPRSTPGRDVELGFRSTDNWVLGQSGQYHFMGNSSTTYIANRLNPTSETLAWNMYPHYEDTAWLQRPAVAPALPRLPPYELAHHLYRAQRSFIGTIFSFLSDADFDSRLGRVYSQTLDPTKFEDSLIYCQVFLVFAFGQMYSINQWVSHDGPPGFAYFKHALEFLPRPYEAESVLFIEVMSYVAYFMQTINRRDAAYLYTGTALRMAVSLGLHQEASDGTMDRVEAERRRRVWWSTYSMDRLLSVTSGHPISIHDDDIEVLPPSPLDGEDAAHECLAATLACYTELSRIQGIIGEEIYRKKRKSGTDLSACVQNIMAQLSDWFEHLPESVRCNPPTGHKGPPQRDIISIYLHYHHCINMTARPILLYAIQRQIAANSARPRPTQWQEGLSQDIVGVIDKAISAARSTAFILDVASRHDLVATYGFIDGEHAFSAALLLVMVNIAFPYNEPDATAMNVALGVLHAMSERDNKYMRACHSTLTKIKTVIASRAATGGEDDASMPQERTAAADVSASEQPTTVSSPANSCPPSAADASFAFSQGQDQDFAMDLQGDPGLWDEVLGSIGIDMDRQWVESAFLHR